MLDDGSCSKYYMHLREFPITELANKWLLPSMTSHVPLNIGKCDKGCFSFLCTSFLTTTHLFHKNFSIKSSKLDKLCSCIAQLRNKFYLRSEQTDKQTWGGAKPPKCVGWGCVAPPPLNGVSGGPWPRRNSLY